MTKTRAFRYEVGRQLRFRCSEALDRACRQGTESWGRRLDIRCLRQPVSLRTLLAPIALSLLTVLAVGCRTSELDGPETGASAGAEERGVASWYGGKFHGRMTANGETYDMNAMTAAHKTLPFGTLIEVSNLDNGRLTQVRINDRGPFVKGRILDLSYAAAREIDMVGPGTARVEIRILSSPEEGPLTVQVGAFQERHRAEALGLDLERDFTGVQVHHDGTWYRVRVGSYETREEANEVRRSLRRLGLSALIIPEK